jgi:MFS superfamily sulfate permease-like transporter
VGVIVATVVAALLGVQVQRVPIPANLFDAITLPTADMFSRLLDKSIWVAAISLAFVASAESLLTATAVDTMQNRAPRTNYNRELVAQGVGNTVCGVLGLLPITGVIVRSSANVIAGAQTRLSSVLHGVWILAFIVLFPDLLRIIPLSALAAVLVYTGVRLMKFQTLTQLWRTDRAEAIVFLVTLGTVIAIDLLTGIVVGLIAALLKLLYSLTHLEITVVRGHDKTVTIHLKGAATFLRLPQLAANLESLPQDALVHVQFDKLTYIDHACLELLIKWEQQHKALGGELTIDWESLHGVFQRNAWNASVVQKGVSQVHNSG